MSAFDRRVRWSSKIHVVVRALAEWILRLQDIRHRDRDRRQPQDSSTGRHSAINRSGLWRHGFARDRRSSAIPCRWSLSGCCGRCWVDCCRALLTLGHNTTVTNDLSRSTSLLSSSARTATEWTCCWLALICFLLLLLAGETRDGSIKRKYFAISKTLISTEATELLMGYKAESSGRH